jgi:uncharacterized protein YbjT (DUF2867 family)
MAAVKILVTGAAGKTGGAVARALLARDQAVRAVVRVRDARSEALARQGAEIVVADLFDPDQLLAAARGTQRAYYVPPMHPYALQSAVAFSIAAREARLESIVQMGQWLSHRAHPAILTRHTWLMDQVFAELPGISHTILNPGMFADNFLRTIDFAALLGVYPVLSGGAKAAPVANEDMARVVVAILMSPDRHAGMSYRPTGPQLLSGREMAGIIAIVVGHRVAAVGMPFWLFGKVARQQRVDPFQIASLRYYMQEMRRGAFEFEGGVTSTVEDLTGVAAESFETTARRYAALPFARQSAGNRLKAMANFALTPLHPGYDLKRLERGWGFPAPPAPTLSIGDTRWRREHSLMMDRAARLGGAPMMAGAA